MPNISKSIKAVILAIILALLIICAWYFQQNMQLLISSIKDLGMFAPFLFVTLYILATVLLLPTMVLTFAGGAIFGPFLGTIFNMLGATLGACAAFIISRYLAFNWFSQRRNDHLNHIINGVDERGWQFVAFLRVFPIIPFNLVNYGMGITNISFRVYALTTLIFLLPPEIIYTYCGYTGVALISNPDIYYKNTGIVILAILVLLLLIIKILKKKHASLKNQALKKTADAIPPVSDAQD